MKPDLDDVLVEMREVLAALAYHAGKLEHTIERHQVLGFDYDGLMIAVQDFQTGYGTALQAFAKVFSKIDQVKTMKGVKYEC